MTSNSPAEVPVPQVPVAEVPVPEVPVPEVQVDRRRLRTERGRDLVVDALLAFYAEGEPQPGAARIAARAGVSERSVFRYFDDLESLVTAAVERQTARVAPVFAPPQPAGPLPRRIGNFVDQRLRIYDATATANAAARQFAGTAQALTDALALRRRVLRAQVADLFAAELARYPERARAELVDALDAAASLEMIGRLRETAGHSPARTRAVLIRITTALLAH